MATVLASCFFSLLVINDLPIKYLFGSFLACIVIFIFATKPVYFLCGLLLLRPVMDSFLVSVRISFMGLGGLISLALTLGATFSIFIDNSRTKKILIPIVGMYLIFCLFQIPGFFLSPVRIDAAKALNNNFSVLAILILLMLNIRQKKDAVMLLKAIVFSALLPILYGLVVYVVNDLPRFNATFGHPNPLAFFLLVILGCVLFQVDHKESFKSFSWIRIFYFGLLVAGLLLTETRSAWLAFVIFFGLHALFFNRKWIFPLVGGCVGLVFTPIFQDRIMSMFFSRGGAIELEKNNSLSWRFEKWEFLWRLAVKKPWTGYGIDADKYISPDGLAAHNDYLRVFFQSGIFGIFFYFIPYLYLFIHAISIYRKSSESSTEAKIAGFLICFIPAFLVMSYSENLMSYLVIHWYVWGLVGIYFSCIQLKKVNLHAI